MARQLTISHDPSTKFSLIAPATDESSMIDHLTIGDLDGLPFV
jgi:hypothetical protein